MANRAQDIEHRLESITNLPTLPPVIGKLREAVRDPDSGPKRVRMIIEDDPSMMARILKIVNSPLFAGWAPVSSLDLAISRLGFNAMVNIATTTAVFGTYARNGQTDFGREDFWRHSISTGAGVTYLYERCKPNLQQRYTHDLLHLAGLLHDLGKIVLEMNFHAEFMQAIALARAGKTTLTEAEHKVLGADHAEVGAWLGMRWHLPPEVLQVIRWHHQPEAADIASRELVMLVHSVDYICNLQKIGESGNAEAPEFQQTTWRHLGLAVREIPEIVDQIVERSSGSEVLMSLCDAAPEPAR